MSYSNDDIVQEIVSMDNDSKALKKELLKISWFMRGGLPYSEAIMTCPQERELLIKLIEENLETTKESGLPFF